MDSMSISISSSTLEKFTTFGDLLRFLRRRVGITQVELATAVGYSDTQISRLEQNQRPPDIPTIEARFISALDLENEPKVVTRLLDLAANVRREDAPGLGLCPYKGLSYFDEGDADLFVGREELTAKLTGHVLSMALDEPQVQMRFLAVVGASGSGKSSLVRAGMVPALRWDMKSTDWHIPILTPTAHPLESLATSLTLDTPTVTSTAMLMDDLLQDERSLHLFAVRKLQTEKNSHLLLVIDQFEEVFALCRSERERAAFIGNLLTAMSEPDGPISVVITLRADFYAHCANYGQLRKTLSQNQEYIGAMDTDELRRAIEEPALNGNWELEPGLVDVLLRDVGQEPGALPLLSHALMETWQRRRGRTMTLGGYTSSGGVHGAIAETAEAVYLDQLTNKQQSIARRIFLRLTEIGDDTSVVDTRRRATIDELILNPEETTSTRAVLKALADARLIITDENSVEVAHEALIREWPTLRDWLEQDREGLRLHRRLTDTAHEWEMLERDDGVLYRGAQLAQAREWAESNPNALSANENEFLNASITFEQNKVAEHEARQKRELETAQKLAETERQSGIRLRLRNRVISTVGVVAIILAGVAFAFSKQSSENAQSALNAQATAQSNADLAESEASVRATAQAILQTSLVEEQRRRLIAEANSLLGMGESGELPALLALQSLKINYDPEAQALLYRALDQGFTLQKYVGHEPEVWHPSFSPDGRYILTAGGGDIRLWDPETGEELKRITVEGGANPTFSPDGKWIVSGSPEDYTVRFWDVETGELIRTLEGHEAFVYVPIFSPDGKYLLTFSDDHTARLWDPNDGRLIFTLEHPDSVTGAAISPDSRTILTAGLDFMIREWDIQTGKQLRVFEHPNEDGLQIQTLQYAPDGRTFFSAPVNNMVYQWDVGSGEILHQFTISKDERLIFADVSPSGRYLIAGSTENIIYLWDVESGNILRTYTGHHGNIYGLDFSPDGRSFVAGEEGGTPRLWATMTRSEPFFSEEIMAGLLVQPFHPMARQSHLTTMGLYKFGMC